MRVDRTVAFVDLCGFTRFTEIEGDEQAVAVLVRAASSDHGVRVAKWLGDGAMFVAVEPAAMLGALLAIDAELAGGGISLPVRAGATTGEVILFEGDDHIGSEVNLASRLCDLANPREIVLTLPLLAAMPQLLEHATIESVRVAGFAATVDVVRVRQAVPATL